MGNQKPEDSTTTNSILSTILNVLRKHKNKHDDNNNNTGAMKITPTNTTTAVCLTTIALCLSPLGVAIAFGQQPLGYNLTPETTVATAAEATTTATLSDE